MRSGCWAMATPILRSVSKSISGSLSGRRCHGWGPPEGGREKVELVGSGDGDHSVVAVQLAVDVVERLPYGPVGDPEPATHCMRGQPFGEDGQDTDFAGGEARLV